MTVLGELAVVILVGFAMWLMYQLFRPAIKIVELDEMRAEAKLNLLEKVLIRKGIFEAEDATKERKALDDKMYDDMHEMYDKGGKK